MLKWISLGLGLVGLASAAGLLLDGGSRGEGARTSLHGNGSPKESTSFVEGLRHGPTQRWYPDGQLRAEGLFEQGEMVGEWIWYAPDGSVDRDRSGVYRDGRRLLEADDIDLAAREGA